MLTLETFRNNLSGINKVIHLSEYHEFESDTFENGEIYRSEVDYSGMHPSWEKLPLYAISYDDDGTRITLIVAYDGESTLAIVHVIENNYA